MTGGFLNGFTPYFSMLTGTAQGFSASVVAAYVMFAGVAVSAKAARPTTNDQIAKYRRMIIPGLGFVCLVYGKLTAARFAARVTQRPLSRPTRLRRFPVRPATWAPFASSIGRNAPGAAPQGVRHGSVPLRVCRRRDRRAGR